MNHDLFKEQAEIYALGALDGRELEEFQRHLSGGCVECERSIEQNRAAMDLFAQSSSLSAPPVSLKTRVLSRLEGSAKPLTRERLVPAASALIGVGLLAASLFIWLSPKSVETIFLSESAGHNAKMQTILSSPDLKQVFLQSSDPNSERYAILAWNPKSCGGCFVIKGLSAQAAGKIYQLWAIEGNKKPVSVGTFTVDQDGNAHVDFVEMKNKQTFDTFSVSLEPAGGSVLPAGPTLLLGRL